MMHSGFHNGWFCGAGGYFSGIHFGGMFHFILWGLLLYVIYRISRSLLKSNNDATAATHESAAMTILEQRYAAGEIEKEEFNRIKNDLGR